MPSTLNPPTASATASPRQRPTDATPTRAFPGPPQALHRRPHLTAASLWWMHPSLIILLVLLPIYTAILSYDFSNRVAIRYVPGFDYWFGYALLLAMVVGIQWALSQRHTAPAYAPAPYISSLALMVLLVPTLLSYALWFGPVLARPELLMEVFRGERPEIRDDISTIKGVTTFTQWGIAYAIGYAMKAAFWPQTLSRLDRIGLALVFVLAAFRAFAWAERLAVIELTICFVVTRLSHVQIAAGWRSQAMRIVPAVAPLALFGLFTLSEYFRTWEHLQGRYGSVWELSLDRLITYYATAVNNGIGVLVETEGWPFYSGAFAFESFWRMPGLEKILTSALEDPRWAESEWLAEFGDPAFNSPTAYFRTILDLGYFGSLLYHLALGYLIGRAYMGWQRGHVFGLLMYAVFMVHLLESLRFSYLAETRFIPLVLGLLVLAVEVHRQRRAGGAASTKAMG